MKISIIGSGWVGTMLGKTLAKSHGVIFYDIDKARIEKLKSEGFFGTVDIKEAVSNSDVSFLCVPTPTADGKIDISYMQSACENLGSALADKNGYHFVIVKSTVIPGTCDTIVIPILEKFSKKSVGEHFGVCMNPEFLTEISGSWTKSDEFSRTPETEEKFVIGESDKRAGDILEQLYAPFNKPIFRTDLKTAEFIKYASNCCLASRISFWNEMFLVCQKTGVDSDCVAKIVGMDKRIGTYGTVHGKAFGGKCLPKDLKAFISCIEKFHEPVLLKAVDEINERMKAKYGVRE